METNGLGTYYGEGSGMSGRGVWWPTL